MDSGDESSLRLWRIIQNKSLLYFNRIFQMFSIEFDQQVGESEYRHRATQVVELMKQTVDFTEDDNGVLCFKLHNGRPRKVSKQDQMSSTYLTRDIAAALDRINAHPRLRKLFYVVDKAQIEHFENLFFVLHKILNSPNEGFGNQIKGDGTVSRDLSSIEFSHVQFGRVIGMSARKNQTINLERVLDECERLVLQRMQSVNTTKSHKTQFKDVSHKLAIAALVVNCFSYKVR